MREIPSGAWRAELERLAADGYAYLDLLTVVDRGDELEVVARVVDVSSSAGVLVSTRVPAQAAVVDSIVASHPAAAWHEREAAEMFGLRFRGSTDERPLLTDGSAPPLLRKQTPLPMRVQTPWPGADESARRRARTPGVRDEWVQST